MAAHIAVVFAAAAVALGALQRPQEATVIQCEKELLECFRANKHLESEHEKKTAETLLQWLYCKIAAGVTCLFAAVKTWQEYYPCARDYWRHYQAKAKLSKERQVRQDELWRKFMPDGHATFLPVEEFKCKAKSSAFFKYLAADGLDIDLLADKIDADQDDMITRAEFYAWYERLDRFRPDANNASVILRTVFVGKGRVGKSTLLNSLLRATPFKAGCTMSGSATTTGLTIESERRNMNDCPRSYYVNIPGVWKHDDEEADKIVQDLITVALTPQRGFVKLVFVVTAASGDIDEYTRHIIRDTLQISHSLTSYGVIVNKCTPEFMKKMADEENRNCWIKEHLQIDGGKTLTNEADVFFFPRNDDADDKDNVLLPEDDTHRDLKKFLFNLHCNDMRGHPDIHRLDETVVKAKGESIMQKRLKRQLEDAAEADRKERANLGTGNTPKRQRTNSGTGESQMCIIA
eukprot:TRINITY_DN15546_c0_g1_i3.p1 TRINITY_DN15546_c0_g1~~TRINITY_DN15546_c0_g1_i3.p1  ORF type:complete len:462 (+),score=74.71 TRINITY_DN15546_c0_g1_i3:66-1451(+)